jgi:serine/threonine protein kinase/tetratricopeptide (TPR) repeat protein
MTQLNREEWAALSRLLDEALEMPAGDRAQWIAERRLENPEMAAELEALLDREAGIADDFLSTGVAPRMPATSTLAGQTLGAYVLEGPLGQGGMGSVWMARRSDGRFEGVAAIKLLSLAVAGPVGEERFRREGSVLARLTHPNIARLLDAGVSPSGLPYLVLEFIDGKPIDEWCDARKLTIDARLRLFQQVLAAVAHAHASFIVHRDLKPANILVTNDGTVKLLDFGIAKLLEEGGATSSALTGAHDGVFTYQYAAPEQIKGEPITTATDVYGLGVILYELLAGRHPTSSGAHTPAEHVVAILKTDSGQLSRAVSPSAELTPPEAQRLAAARDASPEKLHRIFSGDLDNIVAKTLKKDPAERYATVGALEEDVRHYLNHEPVSARADSFKYRASKFVRRHRVPVALAVLATIGLVGAAARERTLRGRAETEAKKAVAVEEYLVSVFGAADPFAPTPVGRGNITARELLDRGALRMDTSLIDQPEVRAELRGALGRVYANLGVYDKATSELRSSLVARRALYRGDNASVAEAMDRLGEVLMQEDSLDEADSLLSDGLAMRRRLFGDRNAATAESLEHLAELYENRDQFDKSEPLFRQALAMRRGMYGDSDLTVAASRDYLGRMLHSKGADTEAIPQYQIALAIRTRRLGEEHPATAETIHDIAVAEEDLGRYADAERDDRRALAIERKTLGSNHRSVSLTLNDLGQLLFKLGRLGEADTMLRQALAINRRLFGENHEAVSANLSNLALIVRERGDFDEAERLLQQALKIDLALRGPEHIDVGFDLNEIAVVMRLEGRPDSAVVLLRQALAMSHRVAGADARGTLIISVNLGRALSEAGRNTEAEPFLREALAKLDTNNADERLAVVPGRIGLGRVLLGTHRAAEALPVMRSAAAMSSERQGADHWRTGESELVLGECFLALGQADSAEAHVRDGRNVLMKYRTSHPLLAQEADAASARLAVMQKGKR